MYFSPHIKKITLLWPKPYRAVGITLNWISYVKAPKHDFHDSSLLLKPLGVPKLKL